MREKIDFRIPERNAQRHLRDDVGERLGDTVRRVEVFTDDPQFTEIGRLEREFRSRDDFFFLGWAPHRSYSRREIEAAKLFHLHFRRMFEPAGEECGTVYDESKACPICGVGAIQKTPLFLDGRKIPKKVDLAYTIADELVVSARVREIIQETGLNGAEFDPIMLSNMGGAQSRDHFQLKVVGQPVELDNSTRTGETPFDESNYGRCPRGHVAGLNLLSEVTIVGRSLGNADIMVTRQMVGHRYGLLRPAPILLISPKAWRVIEEYKLKGLKIEVAHIS